MKLRAGPWDGAQSRGHVLDVLRKHDVEVINRSADLGDDYYELVDLDGDPEVLHIPNPVLSETIIHLYRRFGELHRIQITEFVRQRRH